MNLSRIIRNHLNIFLLDAIGAFISIILLLFLIKPHEIVFGLSQPVAINLVIPISVLLLFSTSCFFLKPQNWKLFMKFVVLGNIAYCLFTSVIILLNFKELTIWGELYFLSEILVIFFIVGIEIATIRK